MTQTTAEIVARTGQHPNSMTAIGPHKWKPGQSGNPKGAKAKGGDRLNEKLWATFEVFHDQGVTVAQLKEIVKDEKRPAWELAAAQWLLKMAKSGERWVIGKNGVEKPAALDPEPGRERERFFDRVMGKPAVTVEQHHHRHGDATAPRELRRKLIDAVIHAAPEVLAEALRIEPKLERQLPVDTTATVLPAAEVVEQPESPESSDGDSPPARQQMSTADADPPGDKHQPVFRPPDEYAKVATALLVNFNEHHVHDAARFGRAPQSLMLFFDLLRDHGDEFTLRQIAAEADDAEPRIVIEDREGRPQPLEPYMQKSVAAMLRYELLKVGEAGVLVPGKGRPDLRLNLKVRP